MLSQSIDLPFPPTVNTYYRSIVRGKRAIVLISEKGREYRKAVAQLVQIARLKSFGQQRLAISINAYMPDRRRRDLDNLTKSVQDSLCHAGVFDDDSQIDQITIRRMHVQAPGRIAVQLLPIGGPPCELT